MKILRKIRKRFILLLAFACQVLFSFAQDSIDLRVSSVQTNRAKVNWNNIGTPTVLKLYKNEILVRQINPPYNLNRGTYTVMLDSLTPNTSYRVVLRASIDGSEKEYEEAFTTLALGPLVVDVVAFRMQNESLYNCPSIVGLSSYQRADNQIEIEANVFLNSSAWQVELYDKNTNKLKARLKIVQIGDRMSYYIVKCRELEAQPISFGNKPAIHGYEYSSGLNTLLKIESKPGHYLKIKAQGYRIVLYRGRIIQSDRN